jgi:hypothetical protein
MAGAKLLNLLAVSTLAILASSFGATPVTAVSVDTAHIGARGHAHAALAKKRRSNTSKKCKPRSPPATPAPAPASSKPAQQPATTPKPSGNNNNNNGNTGNNNNNTPPPPPPSNSGSNGGSGKVGLAWAVNDDKALANFKTDKVSP